MGRDQRVDFGGEPLLTELMADPVLQTMVASSGLDRGQFLALITDARSRLARRGLREAATSLDEAPRGHA